MNQKDIQQQTEHYLRGEMTETERSNFLNAAQQNPALADELAFQQQLFRELGDTEKQQFVAQLASLSGAFFSAPTAASPVLRSISKFILPIVGAGILISILGWYVLTRQQQPASVESARPPDSNGVAMMDGPNVHRVDSTVAMHPMATTPALPDKTPSTAVERPAASTSTVPAADPVDFVPNAYWEGLAARKLVGSDRSIRANARLSGGKKLTLKINMEWPGGETPAPMVVSFYSNKDQDRTAATLLKQVTLELLSQVSDDPASNGKKSYSLEYSAGVNWKPGLYYYVISFEKDAQPILVGKLR